MARMSAAVSSTRCPGSQRMSRVGCFSPSKIGQWVSRETWMSKLILAGASASTLTQRTTSTTLSSRNIWERGGAAD